jgi:hypothetical protein
MSSTFSFSLSPRSKRRIGRKRFEVCESCRQFIYALWRDVSTRPDGSILKGPQCGEGFHLSSLKQLREFLGAGLAGRGLVQANGRSNEGRESLLIDFIVLVEVDCAPGVAFEA